MSFRQAGIVDAPLREATVLAGRIGSEPRRIVWIDPEGSVADARWQDDSATLRRGPVGGRLLTAGITDFDGDGVLDIVSAHGEDGASVHWIPGSRLRQSEGGLEGSWVVDLASELGGSARVAAIGRFDSDGLADVIIARDGQWRLLSGSETAPAVTEGGTIEQSRGWWAVQRPHSHRQAPVTLRGNRFAILDLDEGALDAIRGRPVEGTPNAGRVHVGDVDGDGRPDVLSVEDAAVVLWSDMLEEASHREAALPTTVHGSVIADIDHDGRQELLIWNASGEVSLVRWHRDGSAEIGHLLSVAAEISSIAVDDLDHDGLMDIVAATKEGPAHVMLASCACDSGWTGPRCETCSDPGCTSVGGELEAVWIGPARHVRVPAREAAKRLAATAAPGQTLSTGQIIALQTLAAAALEADVVAVVEAGAPGPRLTSGASVETSVRIASSLRGPLGQGERVTVQTVGANASITDVPRPLPTGVPVLATLIRGPRGWTPSRAEAHWRIAPGNVIEAGHLKIPLERFDEILAEVTKTAP